MYDANVKSSLLAATLAKDYLKWYVLCDYHIQAMGLLYLWVP